MLTREQIDLLRRALSADANPTTAAALLLLSRLESEIDEYEFWLERREPTESEARVPAN